MGPIVVDVGNTRIKWGLCSSDQVWSVVSLPPDDADAWSAQWRDWNGWLRGSTAAAPAT